MFKQIVNSINESEYVLIGIGDRFGYDWNIVNEDARYNELYEQICQDESLQWLLPFLQKIVMDMNPDERLIKAYDVLADITDGKNAYFITTTIDDYIYNTSIPAERIVAPCGGFRKLQCEDACSDEVINVPNALLQYVQKLYNNEMSIDEMRDKYPECPDCGANLVFNQVGCKQYVEAGYLVGWGIYHKWLEKTMNRSITLLELGAGIGFMSVIRSPFEKLTEYNRKAIMYRVHSSLYMPAAGLDDRCVGIKADPIELLINEG